MGVFSYLIRILKNFRALIIFLFTGTVIAEKDRCKACQGKKTTKETKLLEVPVDPGMREHQKIHFRGEGDQEVKISHFYFYYYCKTILF